MRFMIVTTHMFLIVIKLLVAYLAPSRLWLLLIKHSFNLLLANLGQILFVLLFKILKLIVSLFVLFTSYHLTNTNRNQLVVLWDVSYKILFVICDFIPLRKRLVPVLMS